MPKISSIAAKTHQLLKPFSSPNLTCAFSHRRHKNMSLFYGNTDNSLNNRKAFLSDLGIDYNDLVCAKQVHGSQTKYAQEEDRGSGALSYDTSLSDTDAFITDKKNLPLAIFTADCLPIFLYEPATPVIGLIHAGWRSSKEGIAAKTVQLMKGLFNIRMDNLYVGFGPAIRECCCEVSEEFNGFFSVGVAERNNRRYLDLAGINKKQVLDLGVKEVNIFDPKICTSCQNEEFFSYRREGKTSGRMIAVIMLK